MVCRHLFFTKDRSSSLLRSVCDKSVLLDGFMQDILNKKDK